MEGRNEERIDGRKREEEAEKQTKRKGRGGRGRRRGRGSTKRGWTGAGESKRTNEKKNKYKLETRLARVLCSVWEGRGEMSQVSPWQRTDGTHMHTLTDWLRQQWVGRERARSRSSPGPCLLLTHEQMSNVPPAGATKQTASQTVNPHPWAHTERTESHHWMPPFASSLLFRSHFFSFFFLVSTPASPVTFLLVPFHLWPTISLLCSLLPLLVLLPPIEERPSTASHPSSQHTASLLPTPCPILLPRPVSSV